MTELPFAAVIKTDLPCNFTHYKKFVKHGEKGSDKAIVVTAGSGGCYVHIKT